jgi:hypothetical protein
MKKLLSILILFFILIPFAFSATTPNSGIAIQTPNVYTGQLTTSPGTYVKIVTGASNGTKVSGLSVSSSDTSTAHLVTCQVYITTTASGGTAVTIPIGAGFISGTAPVNMLSLVNWPGLPIDGWGNPYLIIPSGDFLECTYATALSLGQIDFVGTGGDF